MELVLIENKQKAAGKERQDRLQPSSLCRAFQQLGHFPRTPIHLADPTCLEMITCK